MFVPCVSGVLCDFALLICLCVGVCLCACLFYVRVCVLCVIDSVMLYGMF